MVINGTEINIGTSVSENRTVTLDLVKQYADISGDVNPIHLDEKYAEKSFFGARIAHALFCLGMVSKIIGTVMPGEGSIFLNESIDYYKPVYIGDSITTKITVIEIRESKRILNLEIKCTNQKEELVLSGTTLVKMI